MIKLIKESQTIEEGIEKDKFGDNYYKFEEEDINFVKSLFNNNELIEVTVRNDDLGSTMKVDLAKTNYVNGKVMKYITELDNPSKIIGICHKKNDKIQGNHILILDDIQDPGNLGTIIRSAVAFNIDTIILSKTGVDLYNSKVLRSTQGMIFNINIVVSDIKEEILKLKSDNYKILTTNVEGGKLVKSIEKNQKFAIIIGNEGKGVSKEIKELSDEYIYIEMNKKCESLNAAVATSIILYELSR